MEKENFLVTVSAHFDAAHSIQSPEGMCERLHGHRWKVEAAFSGSLQRDGIVHDFLDLEKKLKKRVISKLDHSNLDDLFEVPTTELICRWIWEQLKPLGVVEIRLWETPDFSIIYRGGDSY
jgi:6-pyruvoyltetrahydropterin/6-carboxytetrahydropterin synthase